MSWMSSLSVFPELTRLHSESGSSTLSCLALRWPPRRRRQPRSASTATSASTHSGTATVTASTAGPAPALPGDSDACGRQKGGKRR